MQTTSPDQMLSQLREALGLTPETDFPAILEKIRGLATANCAATPDPSQFVPIGLFQATAAELQAIKLQGDEQAATRAVEDLINGAHLLPHWRDWVISLCRANKPAFEQFVKEVSPFFAGVRGTQTGGLSPEQRGAYTQERLNEAEVSICRALGHSQEDVIKFGGK